MSVNIKFDGEGTGTKKDPFKIPVVPLVKTKLKPLYLEIEVLSSHGGNTTPELYNVGFRTEQWIAVGGSVKESITGGIKMRVPLYARNDFQDKPEKIYMAAFKYASKTPAGQFVNAYRLLDPNFTSEDGWSGNDYWAISYTAEEMVEYAKLFETPKAELPITIKGTLDLPQVDEVVELQSKELSEVEDMLIALEKRVSSLEGGVKAEPVEVVVEPIADVYVEENVDGINFSVDHEWIDENTFILNLKLDNVDEYEGFANFQFDVPFINGTNFVDTIAEGTYFDNTPANDGTFDEAKVISGWTWRAFRNDNLQKIRVSGFASSLSTIYDDGTLVRMKYDVTDSAAENFTFFFNTVRLNGLRTPVNPKNPRYIVTKD